MYEAIFRKLHLKSARATMPKLAADREDKITGLQELIHCSDASGKWIEAEIEAMVLGQNASR
jgi:hypothetical protein